MKGAIIWALCIVRVITHVQLVSWLELKGTSRALQGIVQSPSIPRAYGPVGFNPQRRSVKPYRSRERQGGSKKKRWSGGRWEGEREKSTDDRRERRGQVLRRMEGKDARGEGKPQATEGEISCVSTPYLDQSRAPGEISCCLLLALSSSCGVQWQNGFH